MYQPRNYLLLLNEYLLSPHHFNDSKTFLNWKECSFILFCSDSAVSAQLFKNVDSKS